MPFRWLTVLALLADLLLPVSGWPVHARERSPIPLPTEGDSDPHPLVSPKRRANAPHFDGDVRFSETAIFWFGHVTPTHNSVDVRVGYSGEYLYVHVAAFDRRLWYDETPSPGDLTAWDAVTLYLDLDGDVGDALDGHSHRFDAQLVWWEDRATYQAAYRGDGSHWVAATTPFSTTSNWRGDIPNNNLDDRGWVLTYYVPFDSLGLGGAPPQGSLWGMAVALHDRDDAAGTPIADQVWPETMDPQRPATWGQLSFGLPTYSPPGAVPGGTVTIRHGLNGATVVDADVGGSSNCGDPAAPDYFSTWGALNYAGKPFVNIQNQYDVSDWPCFSRYYVTFPLNALPAGKAILSATLTLHQFGNAGQGWDPGPQPSLIQVLTIGEDWNERTLTWNNAPLALENLSATWLDPLGEPIPPWPGPPRYWDVSQAVAKAYAAGTPLRLVLYESDWDYHSGKYFVSSDADEWGQEARPTLTVTWGTPYAQIHKTATPTSGDKDDPITYALSFVANGETFTLTDTLPTGVSAPGHFELQGTSVLPTYQAAQHRLTWSDTPPAGQQVTIRYTVSITASSPQALVNTATLVEAGGAANTATATVIANPSQLFLPLTLRVAR